MYSSTMQYSIQPGVGTPKVAMGARDSGVALRLVCSGVNECEVDTGWQQGLHQRALPNPADVCIWWLLLRPAHSYCFRLLTSCDLL